MRLSGKGSSSSAATRGSESNSQPALSRVISTRHTYAKFSTSTCASAWRPAVTLRAEVVRKKLQIDQATARLRSWMPVSLETLERDQQLQWAIERGLQIAAEVSIRCRQPCPDGRVSGIRGRVPGDPDAASCTWRSHGGNDSASFNISGKPLWLPQHSRTRLRRDRPRQNPRGARSARRFRRLCCRRRTLAPAVLACWLAR